MGSSKVGPDKRAPRTQSCPPRSNKSRRQKAGSDVNGGALVTDMFLKLESTRTGSIASRRRTFRQLQRNLHPDKNIGRAEEAKLAFQKLMDQRDSYLSD